MCSSDLDGKPFITRVDVPAGRVQAMWCGVDVPESLAPGTYRGTVRVSATGVAEVAVPIAITVTAQRARAGGADEPWKMTRLKWLNSTIAQANAVIRPYSPIKVSGTTLSLHGRDLTLGADGLPRAIRTYFTPEMTGTQATPVPVLRAPMTFVVRDGAKAPSSGGVRFTRREPGTVQWVATTTSAAWTLTVRGTLEFDGALSYETVLRATKPLDAGDIALVVPYARDAATYAMGLGLKGQARPKSLDWSWDVATKNQDGAWLGGVNAGLAFSLRAENYVRPDRKSTRLNSSHT